MLHAHHHAITGDERSLEYVLSVFERCEALKPCDDFERITGNFHVLLHLYRGLLSACRHTHNRELLDAVVRLWDWVETTKGWVSGGVQEWLIATSPADDAAIEDRDELFYSGEKEGRDKIDESCTVSDWMMLGFELYRETGEGRFLDAAEHTFMDHHRFDFAANGGWCGHRGLWGDTGSVWDCCCSHHGPRCMVDGLRYALAGVEDAAALNLYVPLETRIATEGGTAHLTIVPDRDFAGATLVFGDRTTGKFPLQLRCPPWSNGLRVDDSDPDRNEARTCGPTEHVTLSRNWKAGEQIRVALEPRNGLKIADHGAGISIGADGNPAASLAYGPRTLALREADLGDFGLAPEKVSATVSTAADRIRTELSMPTGGDRLILHHYTGEQPKGQPRPEFLIYLGAELVYAGELTSFVEVPLEGAAEVTLEILVPSPGVAPTLGRWHNVRLLTRDGNITFLDGIMTTGGEAPVRRIFFDRRARATGPEPDGSVRADILDADGAARSVRFVPLTALENELEDPDYDLGGTTLPLLRPVQFRAMLPVLESGSAA